MNNEFENNIPVEETPTEEPIAEVIAEETQTEEAVIEDTPAEEPAIEEAPAEEKPIEEAPAEKPTPAIVVETAYQGAQKPSEKDTKKKKSAIPRVIATSLIAGLVFGAGFGTASYFTRRVAINTLELPSTNVTLNKAEYSSQPQGAIAKIAEECMPSVVAITNRSVSDVITFFGKFSQESTSSGSGIIIGKNDSELLIVTNYHVVNNSKELSVVFSSVEKKIGNQADAEKLKGTDIPTATVKGFDSSKDLAVIAVKLNDIPSDVLAEIKIATIGDSSKLRAGEQVIAIGNALGYGQSVTTGIISAVDRRITMKSADGYSTVTNAFIQTDAAINSGNSGGALLDMNGNLIGINSAKIASEGVEGMGYAIPITDVEEIIDGLMVQKTRDIVDEKSQGFLGIKGADITQSHKETFGMPIGVFISSVEPGLAADKAGLKQGYIITKFDGYSISTLVQLQERLQYYEEGEKISVIAEVPSDGGYVEKEFTVTLSNRSKNINKYTKASHMEVVTCFFNALSIMPARD